MDAREARRAAEKAAREAMNAKVTVVGDLGAAHTEHAAAGDAIEAARVEGRELVATAEARAAALVEAAQQRQRELADTYASAHRAALDAGWTATELERMGLPSPAGTRRRGRAPAPSTPDETSPAETTRDSAAAVDDTAA